MKIKINTINTLTVALLFAVLAACSNQKNKTNKEAGISTGKIQNVEIVHPQNRSFTAEVLITGTARPNQMVTLYAMESGVLSQIKKDIGDKVTKDETIAILENPELLQNQIKLNAEFQSKKSIYERLHSVYEKTPALTNIQTVEVAEADYRVAQAKLDALNSRIGFLTVKAPFTGTITARFVDNGSLLQSGLKQNKPQALVEIQQTNPIRLTLAVPESDAVAIKKGTEVQVTFPELSGEMYSAKISRTSGALDPMSGTMHVEIDLDNAGGKILSGMYAKVLLQIHSRENILSLPILSKIRFQNEDYVFVVEDRKINRVPIKIGLSDKDYFELLNDEITRETQVVINGKGLVNPGQVVNPVLKSEK